MNKIQNKFGLAARQRLSSFKDMMDIPPGQSDLEKLRRVNDFFNQNSAFVDDMTLWHKNDYWATPIEFLLKGAGDCEDYAIAKYFSLIQMGVDENKLRITYVTAIKLNQAHMVLTYYESSHAIPLVLDNLDTQIKPATERNDLLPIYSFNGSNLWLAKNKATGNPEGDSDQLSLWRDLKQRLIEGCQTDCF